MGGAELSKPLRLGATQKLRPCFSYTNLLQNLKTYKLFGIFKLNQQVDEVLCFLQVLLAVLILIPAKVFYRR